MCNDSEIATSSSSKHLTSCTTNDERRRRVSAYTSHSPLESLYSIIPSFGSPAKSPSNSSILDDPAATALISAAASVALTLGGIYGYRHFWRRIRNADYVTSSMLDRKKWIKGVVTSVGDGDNFRLYHTPGPFFHYPLKFRSIPVTAKELKDETIHIRIAGCDAPEAAHFGNPAQPHSKESLDWLRKTIMGKTMWCQLIRKDQYQRIVGVPYIRRLLLPNRPLPVLMLKEGMAVVYESAGGEYGTWGIEGLKVYEAQAKAAKKGLWKLKKFEHPADYKKRMKMAEEGMIGVQETAQAKRKSKTRGIFGLFGRLFGR
ncbi:hypothetical protein BCR39DRAFT_468219 [Naematelia encephala]|uniref:Probable endonuclease LCL3 n=1 Tax=Naematelia encephala TaxID=71784 RepID=A0A1Y2B0Y7_9TREE|nr:hypothetical protein BCR39DRAFT_468219 [Naematelia encephala]